MTARLPFTEHSLRKRISAVRKEGLFVTGIRPDGTLLVSTVESPPIDVSQGVQNMERNECRHCQHWTRANPDDENAPEGYCGLSSDPGFWPFGYWPSTLQKDGCGDGFQEKQAA